MSNPSIAAAAGRNFLGNSPIWYKIVILVFLLINPIILQLFGSYITGWVLIAEFIFTLSMALKCYPLLPGGLLAIEAMLLKLSTPAAVLKEVNTNLEVLLLLIFMVAGIYFMKSMLLFIFTKLLINVRNKIALSFLFSFSAALLSAFLDALTVTAVLIAVAVGFYNVYHQAASDLKHDHGEKYKKDLEEFRSFLRSILMHGAVGTALGGVCTIVGEPQNLLIGERMGWHFADFFINMAHVTMPTLVAGLATCILLEITKKFGYGAKLPDDVRSALEAFDKEETKNRTSSDKAKMITQGIVAILLVLALGFHIAPVGLIGLAVIVLLTTFNGITEEAQIGHAFEEALPFTALLVVFFAIVAVIHEQHLFTPIIEYVLSLPYEQQPKMFFLANGLLSAISDNVFVATVYIDEVYKQFVAGNITPEHMRELAVAINTGTNLPSVATPNGQAAFLFLLTSAIAPLIRLSYMRMVYMALPYTIVLTLTGLYFV